MKRPTIADLARASGVSVSTVNRILSGAGGVRPVTMQLVQDTAAEINFYGRGLIESRRREAVPAYRFGFLLQQRRREIYREFGKHLEQACKLPRNAKITPVVEFDDDLAPENVASHLREMGRRCDALSLVAADHPLIGQAIHELKGAGKPVVTYISDQSAPDRAGHVGTDNWKLGRTAAWFIAKTTRGPGRVALFIGNHRYQSQDIADASFRSYMRENAPHLMVDDSRPTHEEPENAYRIVRELLAEQADLVGIYMGGGGISGVLGALREAPEDRRARVSVVCNDIGPETRRGLTEGLITAALRHPPDLISTQLVETMIDAIEGRETGTILQRTVPFEIVTPESVWPT